MSVKNNVNFKFEYNSVISINNEDIKNLPFQEQKKVFKEEISDFSKYMSASSSKIGEKGLEIIIDYLRNKPDPSLPQEEWITICVSKDFKSKLQEIVFSDVEEGFSHAFIVINKSQHKTPVFLKKKNNQWSIIITDSLGNQFSYTTLQTAIKRVETSSKNTVKFEMSSIYVCTYSRLIKGSGCSIFSIRDLVYFYRNGDQFLDELSRNSYLPARGEVVFFSYTELPPELMKTTQVMPEDPYPFLQSKIHTKKTASGKEFFLENRQRHGGSDLESYNTLIDDRALKYQKIIAEHLFERR
ncbi:MAG: hypothetical protein V4494_06015 [Chlamydiota bacterium]